MEGEALRGRGAAPAVVIRGAIHLLALVLFVTICWAIAAMIAIEAMRVP